MTAGTHEQHVLSSLLDLTGRVALVTGAGQGVGAAAAQMLAGQGASVAVNDYYAERAEAVASGITEVGGRANGVQGDVTGPWRRRGDGRRGRARPRAD